MQNDLKNEKRSVFIFLTFFFIYAVFSLTKNTYSTAMTLMIEEGSFNKADVGVINANFYLIYGCSQMLCGGLVDRFSPIKILAFGIALSGLCNVVMAISSSYTVMLLAWSVNGLAQFGIWPAVLKLVSALVDPVHKRKALSYLSFSPTVGIIISYFIAAAVADHCQWSVLFWISTSILAIALIFLCTSTKYVDIENIKFTEKKIFVHEEASPEKDKPLSLLLMLLTSRAIFLSIPALIRCMLDLGLKSWFPIMIMENYGVSSSFANVIITFLLFVNILGVFIANWLYPKYCKNAVTAIGIFFMFSIVFLVLILFIGRISLLIIVLSLAMVTTLMSSCTYLINTIIPSMFVKQGRNGAVAGFLNSFAALGCTVANFVYGYLSENFGWNVTSALWLILGVVSMLICFVIAPGWHRYTERQVIKYTT